MQFICLFALFFNKLQGGSIVEAKLGKTWPIPQAELLLLLSSNLKAKKLWNHYEDNPEYVMFWIFLAKMYDTNNGLAQTQFLLASKHMVKAVNNHGIWVRF